MACARAIAALSHAERKKVGAILVSGGDGHGIIAEGYNGTPSGFDNCCEIETFGTATVVCKNCDGTGEIHSHNPNCWNCNGTGQVLPRILTTKPEVLHAESNAIAKVAKSANSSRGATMYVTYSPCFECSKMMIQAGIKRVVYDEEYRLTDGLDLLRKAGIEVVKL